jgi:hypothetical protein
VSGALLDDTVDVFWVVIGHFCLCAQALFAKQTTAPSVPRTKRAVCTSFNSLSILSVATILPVPFRYRSTTEIIAHFFSWGK